MKRYLITLAAVPVLALAALAAQPASAQATNDLELRADGLYFNLDDPANAAKVAANLGLDSLNDVPAKPNDGGNYVLQETNGALTWIATPTGGGGGAPTGAAGGDLAGTYPNPTVNFGNAPAGSIPPSAINGSVAPAGAAGGDLAGTYPNPTVNFGNAPAGSIPPSAINGSVAPTGAAGGDLAGTYPNPTVNFGNAPAGSIPSSALATPSDVAAATATGTDTRGAAIAPGDDVLTTNTGDTVNLDALGGSFTGNVLEAFGASSSTISTGTEINVSVASTDFATYEFSTSTLNNGVFTVGAGEAGVYTATLSARGGGHFNTTRVVGAITVDKSGTQVRHQEWALTAPSTGERGVNVSTTVYLDVGDTLVYSLRGDRDNSGQNFRVYWDVNLTKHY